MEKTILATVGELEITKEQMLGILRNFPKEHAQSIAGEEGRLRLLDEMIAGELLYLDATSKGYDEEEGFKEILEEAKRGLLQRYAVNKIFEEIEVSEEEINDYYEKHRENFTQPEQTQAKHILVDSEEKGVEIKKEIEEGLTFEEAAKTYSSCPSKDQGGSLGSFGRGQMVKEFEDAAFNAAIGEVVGPVQTQFGYHLILVEDKKLQAIQPIDEVSENIKEHLHQEKQLEKYHQRVEELKEVYPVKVNIAALK